MIAKKLNTKNYSDILKFIKVQHKNLAYCQDIMIEKKPKDVIFLFDTKNKSIIAHQFLINIYRQRGDYEILKDNYYQKILKLIEKYGNESEIERYERY